jgi:hypothetical protein
MELVGLPKMLPPSAFDVTRDFVRCQYAHVENLLDVVEFGTTNLPGISDVDLIAIIQPHSPVQMPGMEEIYREEQYAPMHKPFVYSEATFRRLRAIDPWIVHIQPLLKKTDGYTIDDIDVLSEEEHRWYSLRFMLQWSTTLLRLIARSKSTGAIPCHLFLGICIVPKYIHRELKRLGINGENDQNVPFYEAIREEWFTLTPAEQRTHMEEGVRRLSDSMQRIVRILSAYLASATQLQPVPATCTHSAGAMAVCRQYPHSFVIDGGERVFVFQQNRTEVEMVTETLTLPLLRRYGGRSLRTIFVFPLEVGALYTQYLHGSGPLSRHVQSRAATDLPSLPFVPSPVLQQFVDLTDQIIDESRQVTAAKYFFEIFGFEHAVRTPLRQYFGVWCANIARWLAMSPLGFAAGKKTYRCTLS